MKSSRPSQSRLAFSVVAVCLLVGHASAFAQSAEEASGDWQSFETALNQAEATDRYVLVHVYAPWCGWCLKMEKEVYPDPRVRSYVSSHFVRTRLNYHDTDATYTYGGRTLNAPALAHEFNVDRVPAVVILNPEGEYLLHLPGFRQAERLLSVLRYIGSDSYKTESLSSFLKDK